MGFSASRPATTQPEVPPLVRLVRGLVARVGDGGVPADNIVIRINGFPKCVHCASNRFLAGIYLSVQMRIRGKSHLKYRHDKLVFKLSRSALSKTRFTIPRSQEVIFVATSIVKKAGAIYTLTEMRVVLRKCAVLVPCPDGAGVPVCLYLGILMMRSTIIRDRDVYSGIWLTFVLARMRYNKTTERR